jgi:hypothetical protein
LQQQPGDAGTAKSPDHPSTDHITHIVRADIYPAYTDQSYEGPTDPPRPWIEHLEKRRGCGGIDRMVGGKTECFSASLQLDEIDHADTRTRAGSQIL